ncbi:MAG: sulfatase [Planctomycetota bacterium]
MNSEPSRIGLALRCLGAASVAALVVAVAEVCLAVAGGNALLGAVPASERVAYLLLVVAVFWVIAVPAAVVGFVVSLVRARVGVAVAALLPCLLVAEAAWRAAGDLRGGMAQVLAGIALGAGVVLGALFWWRPLLISGRGALGMVGAGVLLFVCLRLVPLGPGEVESGEAVLEAPAGLPVNSVAPVRNLLVLLVDTLRADHLGCYGYPRQTSPRMDACALEGTLFENAATPKAKTSPAVASLFTGTWPRTHRVLATQYELVGENVTLAETLKESGFTTFGVSANPNVTTPFGFGQGFDEFWYVGKVQTQDGRRIGSHAGRLRDQTIAWLKEHQGERFFAYVHFIDPHSPYNPPPPYRTMFKGDALDGELGTRELEILDESYFDGLHRSVYLPEAGLDLDKYVLRYDGEIRYTDEAIGAILDSLAESGLDDSTLVVITADHGESKTEHHCYFNHGLLPYEEHVHVPLVVRGPGIPAGLRRREQVSLVGLMPTLLDLVGVPVPDRVEAASFAGLLGQDVPTVEGEPTQISSIGEKKAEPTQGLRTNRWKYLFNPGGRSLREALRFANLAVPGRRLAFTLDDIRDYQLEEELYDLNADPLELTNLSYRSAAIRQGFHRQMVSLRESSRPVSEEPRILDTEDFNAELRNALIQLGYVGK